MEIDLAKAISDYGFPIIAAMGMGYFIYFIWQWVTETIDPVIGETMGTLIKLVDRVRMLDNDMIRMNMKLSMVLEHKGVISEHLTTEQQSELEKLVNKYQTRSETFNSTGKEQSMIGAERYCEKCGHRCHCYEPDCKECVNDVCTQCDCGNPRYEALHDETQGTRSSEGEL